MTRTLQTFQVSLFCLLASGGALASPPATPGLAKERWSVSQVSCPLGCSSYTRNFLNEQLGRTVLLGEQRVELPFADSCEGKPAYQWSERSTVELLRELRRSHKPGRQMTARTLKLGAGPVTGAQVLCETPDNRHLITRLLVVEPARLLILFEEQSLIELR